MDKLAQAIKAVEVFDECLRAIAFQERPQVSRIDDKLLVSDGALLLTIQPCRFPGAAAFEWELLFMSETHPLHIGPLASIIVSAINRCVGERLNHGQLMHRLQRLSLADLLELPVEEAADAMVARARGGSR